MASASSMPSLRQKQDLKSLLECPICLETFNDPRTLPCLHSFCKKCLQNFVDERCEDELNCPVCRCEFKLNEGVAGMTRNHFICNMLEVLSIQHQENCIPCSHCQQPSVGRCVTCELFMCEECLQSHNGYIGFRDHVVLTMEELSKPENRSKIKGKSYCNKHPSKKLKLYCETCEELICSYCMSFEHVRPDHECSPLEEIAERKREDLKRVCEILDRNNSHNTESYDELAVTSFYLDKDLGKGKSQIHKEKNSVLAFVKSTLEKKAQRLIKELENAARIKKQTIDEEMKQISDYMAGQRKTYDMAKALIENGSDEEVVLSHKSVRQCVENGEKKYERKEIDDKLPQYDAGKLNRIFSHEIETSGKSTQKSPKQKESEVRQGRFDIRTGKWIDPCNRGTIDPCNRGTLSFDPQTRKLIYTGRAAACDNFVGIKMASAGFVCGPAVDEYNHSK